MKKISVILFFLAAMLWAEEEEHVLTAGSSVYMLFETGEAAVLSDIGTGIIAMLDLEYRYLGRGQSHAFRLLVGISDFTPQSLIGDYDWDQRYGSESFLLGIRFDLRSTFQLYAGKIFTLRFGPYVFGSFDAFSPIHFFSTTWTNELGLGIAAEMLFRVGRHDIEFIMALPLGAYLNRPYLSIEAERALAQGSLFIRLPDIDIITSLHEYLRIEFTMSYSYRVNEYASITTRYDFFYRSIDTYQSSRAVGIIISVSANVHLR